MPMSSMLLMVKKKRHNKKKSQTAKDMGWKTRVGGEGTDHCKNRKLTKYKPIF